jgi:hypothetical protein
VPSHPLFLVRQKVIFIITPRHGRNLSVNRIIHTHIFFKINSDHIQLDGFFSPFPGFMQMNPIDGQGPYAREIQQKAAYKAGTLYLVVSS